MQGRRKHLKLGGARDKTLQGQSSLKLKENFRKIKGALLCLLQNPGGHVPSVLPVPPATVPCLQTDGRGGNSSRLVCGGGAGGMLLLHCHSESDLWA